MRNLYLIRHGQVAFPDNVPRCIGRTDLPLDSRGQKQARELGAFFRQMTDSRVPVFSSPLARALETAELLSENHASVYIEEGLRELDMGEWENVPMSQLKKTLESWPESGESREQGCMRIKEAIEGILDKTEGDVICVAHAGINSCFLARLQGISLSVSRGLPQPYGCFSRIQVDDQGRMEVKELGIMPKPAPDDQDCLHIWNHYGTPQRIRRHCQAVCRQAERLAERLEASGQKADRRIIRSGALLHDVVRGEKEHGEKGAYILRREGYPAVAEVIRRHHDLECPEKPGEPLWLESAVVYLADKQVEEETAVPLDKRFADSRKRCEASENQQAALAAHERRYRQAKKIEKIIQMHIDGGQDR